MLTDAKVKCGRGGLLGKLCSRSAFCGRLSSRRRAVAWGGAGTWLLLSSGARRGRRDQLHASGCWLTWVCTQDLEGSQHTESLPGMCDLETSLLETRAGSGGCAHSRSVRASWVTLWGGEGLRVSLTQGGALLADSGAQGTQAVPWDPPILLRATRGLAVNFT